MRLPSLLGLTGGLLVVFLWFGSADGQDKTPRAKDKAPAPKADKDPANKDNNDGENNDGGDKGQGQVKAVNPAKNTITLTITRRGETVEQTFDLTKDVAVTLLGRLSDVKPGMQVSLNMSKDKKTVAGIKEEKAKEKTTASSSADPKKTADVEKQIELLRKQLEELQKQLPKK